MFLQISVDERTVGRNISTKSIYGDFREDVTLQYKYPEGQTWTQTLQLPDDQIFHQIIVTFFAVNQAVNHCFPTGSAKEREVYLKAGRRIPELTDERAKPKLVTMTIVHGQCVFGTDFDVTVEVKTAPTVADFTG